MRSGELCAAVLGPELSMQTVFLKTTKSTFVSFKQFRTKILDVGNAELYR
jgi:hypothetical protein